MQQNEMIDRINTFLANEFEVEVEKITSDANLRETLQLDSLDYIDLVVVVENNFGFRMKAEDFKGIHTFQDFYAYVNQRIGS
ncbi:MAG: acyl carrier protein [Saprospiraceae bacterium]|nr:acyl carrier protein [Saprospiraceae bacterium]